MKKIFSLIIGFMFCSMLACTIPTTQTVKTQTILLPTPPAPAKTIKMVEDLSITDAGIDFDDTHQCSGAYDSKTSDMTLEGKQKTGYKITTSCKSTGEIHSYIFSNITYNNFGQRDGYKLKLSCSKTGKSYNITVSRTIYSSSWDVLSYTANIDGKDYRYNR